MSIIKIFTDTYYVPGIVLGAENTVHREYSRQVSVFWSLHQTIVACQGLGPPLKLGK